MCFSFNTRYVWQYSRHATRNILRNWTNFGAVPEQRGKKMQVLYMFTDMLLEKKEKILIKVNSSLCCRCFSAAPLLFSQGETTCNGTAGDVKTELFLM